MSERIYDWRLSITFEDNYREATSEGFFVAVSDALSFESWLIETFDTEEGGDFNLLPHGSRNPTVAFEFYVIDVLPVIYERLLMTVSPRRVELVRLIDPVMGTPEVN